MVETKMAQYMHDIELHFTEKEKEYKQAGGSSTKSFRPEAKKEGGWVKTILEKKSIY